MRLTLAWIAALLCCAPPAAAQQLPELGDASAATLSPQMERRIGENVMREIRYQDPAYVDDPEVSDYLQRLGQRLLARVPGAPQGFEFFAMRDPTVNAFALPGGFIGVNTGLLTLTDSESELASVLGHEIGHVTQHHIARLIAAQQQMQLPAMAALAAAILLGASRPDLAAGAAAAAQGGMVQQQLSYTRGFEREADRVGFQTLEAAGFDVRAMPAFFEKLQRNSLLADDGSVPGYLRTHPLTSERIADIDNRAASAPYHQHLDTLDYHLVRAKLRAQRGEPSEAVTSFAAAVQDKRYANEAAARYGLVSARLRAGQVREARADLAALRALGAESLMIETLAARVQQAAGDTRGAFATLSAALKRYPDRLPAIYAYAQALHDAGRYADALAAVEEPIRDHPDDARLRALQAASYAGLGKRLLQHQAQAELYVLRGAVPAAIEQLQLARAAGDGNFYELSAVEARLKELRARHAQDLRDAKR
ncbi:MAG TPA: M48 family metalloprotease [Burkholderiales bacterium]|nr:M48 family metalloprotease [Burkholderiales bacterium]